VSVTFFVHLSTYAAVNPTEIKIGVNPGLQYDVPRFQVKPGQKVKIIFSNTDDMDHNLLIVSPGARKKVVEAAAALGADGIRKNYTPAISEVLWSTPIVHGAQSSELVFTAPSVEGVYPYVCTLPGHGNIMYGAMYVTSSGEMPPIEEDMHIPEVRRTRSPARKIHHPYDLTPPYYYRTYIEGASPAAIIVRLSDHLSYCWDAGVSRFRFAWHGGFVDNTEIWRGHRDAKAEILGEVFYRELKNQPIRIGHNSDASKVQFKGYKIIDGGYLEFHYKIGDNDVFETIKEVKGGIGVVRIFRVPKLDKNIFFHFTKTDGVEHSYKGAKIQGDFLELSPKEGAEFMIEVKLSD